MYIVCKSHVNRMQILYNSYAHNMHILWKSCVNHMQHTTIDINYICILYTNHMHIVYHLHMQFRCTVCICMQIICECLLFAHHLYIHWIIDTLHMQIIYKSYETCIWFVYRIHNTYTNHVPVSYTHLTLPTIEWV